MSKKSISNLSYPTSNELKEMNMLIDRIDIHKPGLILKDPVTGEPRQHLWGDPKHCKDFLEAMKNSQVFDKINALPTEKQHEVYNKYIRTKLREVVEKTDTLLYKADYYKLDGSFFSRQTHVEFKSPSGKRIIVSFDHKSGQIFNTYVIEKSGTSMGKKIKIPHPKEIFRNRNWVKGNDEQWITSRGENIL